jgi:NTE family protein
VSQRKQCVLASDPSTPVGLVLSGGGARGAFQVGVWKVLSEDPCGLGRKPEVISGTSCGAINGVLIAAGLRADEMLDFWMGVADDPPVIANERFFEGLHAALLRLASSSFSDEGSRARQSRILGSLLHRHRPWRPGALNAMMVAYWLTARFGSVSKILSDIATPYFFDATPLKAHLERALGAPEVRRTDVRLAINTVDAASGKVVRIVNHKPQKRPNHSARHYLYRPVITFDMILASAAVPLIFNPIDIESRMLWDGGLLVNTPMAPAVALGAKRIIPVLVTAGSADRGVAPALQTFGRSLERLADTFLENAYAIDRKLLLDRNELAARLPDEDLAVVELFRAIRPESPELFDAGSYYYFERRALQAMYEAGQAAARRWLAAGPELDSRDSPD